MTLYEPDDDDELPKQVVDPHCWFELRLALGVCSDLGVMEDAIALLTKYAGAEESAAIALLGQAGCSPQPCDADAQDLLSRVVPLNVDAWLRESLPSSAAAVLCLLYLEHSLAWRGAIMQAKSAWMTLGRWCHPSPDRQRVLLSWINDRLREQQRTIDENHFLEALAVVSVSLVGQNGGPHGCDIPEVIVARSFHQFAHRVCPDPEHLFDDVAKRKPPLG
jgi:hypothetical protein